MSKPVIRERTSYRNYAERREVWSVTQTTNGTKHQEVLHNVHWRSDCEGGYCIFHNRKPTHMDEWPLHWRWDRRIFERICPCGVGHPVGVKPGEDTVHGCCGCCVP